MNQREKQKAESRKQKFLVSAFGFLVLATALPAQEAPTPPPLSFPTNAPAFVLPPVPLPTLSSPVEIFRHLLTLTPAEQKQYFADRPVEFQRRILAKLREYESLRPNQRELRLRATELQWYLTPLLSVPATNRTLQLALIPESNRTLVAERLRLWDTLSPDAQAELLDNEVTLRYLTQIGSGAEDERQALLKSISPARRAKLEAGIARWRDIPEPLRQKMLAGFNQFFELTPAEQAKALDTLSEAERGQMEKVLGRFDKLPREQREACVKSFAKFTSLSLAERQQFLKNAERWRLMSPDERQAWRDLVEKLPPQLPTLPIASASVVATNRRQ